MGEERLTAAERSIVVNAPVAEVYRRWMCFEELPKFMHQLRDVQRIDETHFSFRAADDDESAERHIVEVVFRNPERRIAWRTVSNGVGLGVVSFEPHPGGGTEVTLKLRSAVTPFLSPQRATEYLREFKQVVEARSA